jgi:[acyl-carrier-protein] S-malonyltransferase
MSLAILCSGQGGQHADMFRLTANEPAAAPIFSQANTVLGFDVRAWVTSAGDDMLYANRNAQVLCVLQALCVAAALRQQFPERLCIAGYSVGELAAWGVAELMSTQTTLELALARATYMDEARQGEQGMLAIRGLSREAIDDLTLHLDADIAICNPRDAYIVGGKREDLNALALSAQAAGASAVRPIRVQIASHTSLMAKAAICFRESLAHVSLSPLRPPMRVLSGIDGDTVQSVEQGKIKLGAQISQSINWDACLQACVEAGCRAFLELGPGHTLASMASEVAPDIPARSVDDFKSLDGVRAWLGRVQ